jgi:hypothetical protein
MGIEMIEKKILFNFLHNLLRVDKVGWKGKKSHQKVAQEVINGNYKRVSLTFIYKNENELSVRAKCPTPSFRGLKKLNTSEHVLNVER